jgi:putative membrane protein insertion efficiency factor
VKSNQAKNGVNRVARVPRLVGARVVDLYAALFSPLVVALFGAACRFEPSCSQYARGAIMTHGLARGAALGAARIARCNPLGGHGFDPVPLKRSAAEKSNSKNASKVTGKRESVSCHRTGVGPAVAEPLENGQ